MMLQSSECVKSSWIWQKLVDEVRSRYIYSIYIDMSRFTNLSWPQTNSFWKLLLLYVDPQTVKYSQAFSCHRRNWCTFPIIKLHEHGLSMTLFFFHANIWIIYKHLWIYDINPQKKTHLKHHPAGHLWLYQPVLLLETSSLGTSSHAPARSLKNPTIRRWLELGWVGPTMWFSQVNTWINTNLWWFVIILNNGFKQNIHNTVHTIEHSLSCWCFTKMLF